ncbi:hypothetical protein QQF64_034339 [Cirrhinus molitorella]|uniref:Ig-like domain-containing protein n=1 Tax=Cirrhinus molitorella TaxID=172907 RepID=A0ABR3L1K5_9TELE
MDINQPCSPGTESLLKSLRYTLSEILYTAVSGDIDFPEFTAVGLVDDEHFYVFWDSNIKKTVPKTEWIRQNEGADYWNRETEIDIVQHQSSKMQRNGLTSQGEMYSCEWDDQTGATNTFKQYGYDGEDFVSLDWKELRYISPVQPGIPTIITTNYYRTVCIEWLQKYVQYGKSSLEKTGVSVAEVFLVSCHVSCYRFYPTGVTITWMRNGQEHHEDVGGWKHSLKYYYTVVTGDIDFPEFTAVGLVDDEQFMYFDSNLKKAVPKTEWIRQNEGADYWDRETQNMITQHQTFKNNIQIAKERLKPVRTTVQETYGCEWDDQTEETNAFRQFGYEGEDFLLLDFNELRFISPMLQGFPTSQKLNNDRGFLETDKHYFSAQCIQWLKKYVEYGKSSLANMFLLRCLCCRSLSHLSHMPCYRFLPQRKTPVPTGIIIGAAAAVLLIVIGVVGCLYPKKKDFRLFKASVEISNCTSEISTSSLLSSGSGSSTSS